MTSKVSSDIFYLPTENPFGKSWKDWSAEWWKWLLSITNSNNPVNDLDGELQGIAQNNPNVYFLGGTHRKKVERTCKVPAGKAILYPVATMSASESEFPHLKTPADLTRVALAGSQVEDMNLTLNVNNNTTALDKASLLKYGVTSEVFDVTLPEDNIYLHVPGGPTKAVSNGYWAFLKPLPYGEHTLMSNQSTKDHPDSGTLNCNYDITYHLTV